MKNLSSLFILFCCIPMLLMGSTILTEKEKDTLTSNSKTPAPELATDQFFQFPELDTKFPMQKKINISSAPEFSFELLEKEYNPPTAAVTDRKKEAKAGFEEINKYDKWITTFSSENIQTLPVGIKYRDSTSQVEYQVGFTGAHFNKDYTEITAYVKVLIPQSDKNGMPLELFFGASNVKLSHQGGLIGDANLVLLGDMLIPFNGGNWLLMLKGGLDMNSGNIQNKTFVTLNCDGIKEMGIEGEVQFSRELIIPVDPMGKPLKEKRPYRGADNKTIQIPNRVTGSFKAVASGWNDMIVEIGISPFVLANQPDMFLFSVNQAVFDFSDLRTENVHFPQHYYDNGLLLPNANTWRGVYVESLEIGLPKAFKTKETIAKDGRVSFKAANLLIDSYGVSGEFMAEGIIPISTGRTSAQKAWAFSLDDIGITLASNRLIGAKFGGQIVLPVSKGIKVKKEGKNGKKETTNTLGLGYKGIISEDEYSLVVSTLNTIQFDVFKAKAELLPNSSVELAVRNGSFRPRAVLNGRMAISASQKKSMENEGEEYTDTNTTSTYNVNHTGDGNTINATTNEVQSPKKKTVEFRGIRFENLVLQTESPIIQVDYFGYEDEVKLANFPVSISDIAFKANDHEAGLEFTLDVSLCKVFGGGTRLGIYGKFAEEGYRQKWKYDRVELQEIHLKADLGGMSIEGSLLLMENHPEYGNGFSAEVKGTFSSFGPVTCKAIFGKKDFRYWYVDGAVHGLKIQAGPIQISGFAGGAYYRMTRRKGVGPKFSPSGLSYIPNADTSIGVKAMVYGAIGDESTISVGAGFEIEFNRHMGLNRIGFFGEAQVMKAFSFPNPLGKLTDKLSDAVGDKIAEAATKAVKKNLMDKAVDDYDGDSIGGEASISAYMAMEYDFVNSSFHAELDLYVNVPGGVIQGRASGGRAGWGVVHISPDEWYVHMGTPTDRLGLKMGIGSFNMETGGYFMMGDRIPGSPPPPQEVADILGVEAETLDYMRDENALGDGRGFAFGADFKIDTGEINFLLLYGRFMAGAGFDIMLKDYGTAKCANTGDVVGIDGWYANGQSYAYLQGEMGINLKLFFVKKRIPIIKGSTAILLQAKGPNPFWMRGYATGEFDLLGGLVKGSYRFKVLLGEECEFEDDVPLGGIKIIADLSPKDGEKDIDVFTAPQASFAMRVNEPVVIPEDDGDKTYKIILEQFDITDTAGKKIEGELEWNYLKDRATFISDDILPPTTPLKVTVQVSFQEQINGVFQTIMADGEKAIEIEERNFTTGTAPSYIPLHNIQYAYPVVDQKLYYPGEYGTGYIQLQRGQDYLFDTAQWQSVVKYIDPSGDAQQTDFNYNTADNKVYYKIPKVAKETTYTMAINSSPKHSGTRTRNETKAQTETTDYGNNNTVVVRKNTAENVLTDGEIERLGYAFKSSRYKTFAAKVKSIKKSHDLWGKIDSKVIYLSSRIENHEGFDLVELTGNSFSENIPLVDVASTLKDTYFNSDIDPLVYQRYTPTSPYTISRDVSDYGFRPKKAIPISTIYIKDLQNEVNLNWRAITFPYRYNLMEIYNVDYRDLYRKINNAYIDGVLPKGNPLLHILYHTFPYMRYGNYDIKMQYTLPGNIVGSSATYSFKNPMK